MNMTVKEMLGQKLVFGFHGDTLSEEFVSLIKEYKIGNVILFLRNVKSASQLRRLCGEIQSLIQQETGYPAFIIIDQEGGMVTRLPRDAVTVPCAMSLAATGDPGNAEKASQITIRQLQGLGANFNMAPVLDVNNNPGNPVIGIRSFGDQPERVGDFGLAALRPYEGSGILCCGKHFPGHGDTAVDSHLGIPKVDKSLEELEKTELVPFRRAIEGGIPAIMISHVMFPQLEPKQVPCTMSREIITGLLKEKLGFRGLVLTDCMEMLAIQNHYGTPQGVVASIQAGVDLAEISSTLSLERDAARAVNEAARSGAFDMAEIAGSVEKILAYKQQILVQPEPALCGREADFQAVRDMTRSAITHCGGTPFPADEDTFFCGCADYRASGAGNEDGSAGPFPAYMGKIFSAPYAVSSKDPDEAEIAALTAQARQYGKLVLGTCNGHLFRGQLALAQALADLKKPMTVVALRNPYDIPLLPDSVCKIAAYDYTIPAFEALADIFRGGAMTGISPVKL